MNNLDYIQSMSFVDIAKWLDENGQFDSAPWAEWFDVNYCKKCKPITCKIEASTIGIEPLYPKQEVDCAYCELHKNCKFFKHLDRIPTNEDIIKMWLLEETEE